MAGAGIKKGITLGATDEFGYNITDRPVHVHDFQATLMHLLGVDHKKTYF
jgi:arylsulfatase A-like enzyme